MTPIIHFLPSGNSFRRFRAINATTVCFDYCDRRRSNQVARRYTVTFDRGSLKPVSIVAVSANGGRVEYFSSCCAIETAKSVLRVFRMKQWENSFALEVEAIQAAKAAKAEKAKEITIFVASVFAIAVISVVLWNMEPVALIAAGLPLFVASIILGVCGTVEAVNWIKKK